jgi:hypothetical protein
LLLGAALSEIFALGVSSGSLLAGKLPYSDAFAYFDGVMRLLSGEKLSVWTSRRPVATSWLSFLAFLTRGNLRGAFAAMTLLNSAALVCAAGEVRKSMGNLPAWIAHVLLFFFYRTFLGAILSEQCGFFFGCMGFALLWRYVCADAAGRDFSFLAGLFLMTVGLIARAGAFFVLPALVLWRVLRRAPGAGNSRARALLASACAVVLVFGYNSALLRTSGYPEASFGNFAPTLYGLLHGGTWTQAYSDDPGLLEMPEIEGNRRIYELSFAKLRREPLSLLRGSLRAYRSFFLSPLGAYSFIVSPVALSYDFHNFAVAQKRGLSSLLSEFLGADVRQKFYFSAAFLWFLAASLLALSGVVRLLRGRAAYRGFVIMAGCGILLSVPFIPPWDAPLMRVYIATAPFFAILPAIALSGRGGPTERERPSGRGMEICSLLLCLAFMAFPFIIKLNSGRIVNGIPTPERNGEIVKIIEGSYLRPEERYIMDSFLAQNDLLADALGNDSLRMFKGLPQDAAIGVGYFPAERAISYVFWRNEPEIAPGRWIEVYPGDTDFLRELRPLNSRD